MKKVLGILMVLTLILTACGSEDSNDVVEQSTNETNDSSILDSFNSKIKELTSFEMVMTVETNDPEIGQDISIEYKIYDENNMYLKFSGSTDGTDFSMQYYFVEDEEGPVAYMEIPMFGWMKTREDMDTESFNFGESMIIEDENVFDYKGEVEFKGEKLHLLVPTLSSAELAAFAPTDPTTGEVIATGDYQFNYYIKDDGTLRFIEAVVVSEESEMTTLIEFKNINNVSEIVVPDDVMNDAIDMDQGN